MSRNGKRERVVILGASDKPDRYAYLALTKLLKFGHDPVPVHPVLRAVDGIPVVSDLTSVSGQVDTLTLYVNPSISEKMADAILSLHPGRVIFNPGTESPALQAKLREAAIPFVEACTLVMLETGEY